MSTRAKDIADWLRERLARSGAQGLVVGLSGGVDSAVVAGICRIAAPGKVVGVVMPCHSDRSDEADALLVSEQFDIPSIRVDLEPACDRLLGDLETALRELAPDQIPADPGDARTRTAFANVQPRLRMTALYFVANALNYLVVGAGNRSELTIGYFTKYGDGGVDLLPIGALLKSEVRALARELGVPASIIEKAPSAGHWAGQTDEDEMGFTYADLERYLRDGAGAVSPALAMRVERLVRMSEHKHSPAPMPDLDE